MAIERRELAGVPVPIIGQGTWQMEHDPRGALAALRAGIDAGLTHIDTAEMYGGGAVESLVGEAIAGQRSRVFIVSKVMPHNASYEGTLAACEASLRRLGCEWIDLYLLHWPGSHPLEGTFAAFERLAEQGKIRAYGVSNFDLAELQRAVAVAGPGRIACDQLLYHLGERYIESALLPGCRSLGIPIVGYSPFGSGRFPAPGTKRRALLDRIASAHGATARQVALRFLVRDPLTLTIPKAGRVDHVRDNAAAAALQLSNSELAEIDRAFAGPPRPAGPLPII